MKHWLTKVKKLLCNYKQYKYVTLLIGVVFVIIIVVASITNPNYDISEIVVIFSYK